MMQYKGYIGKVEFDAQAGILHGEVVGIRDVVTFQGKSVQEVERAFRESVDDYLAFCRSGAWRLSTTSATGAKPQAEQQEAL